ncbi:MAG TPA: NADH-quinone oxidoreductase subunit L [Nitrospirota bacterium]|nr:NADH-quinone oxidoreductase subunit L [Nitrospirota bacterium]
MQDLLFLIPALPFAGFLILALVGGRLPKAGVTAVGVGSVALSALLSLLIGVRFMVSPFAGHVLRQTIRTWVPLDGYAGGFSFLLDPLSLVMVLVITVVGFLIHLYSSEFMDNEEGYSRFFAYMNLFVGSMLTLVLADNLLLLYLGWEGVGVCSYLLIGFWYRDPANGAAARKAFIVTRIGDTAMALGLFLLFNELGTLDIQPLMQAASQRWPVGSPSATLAAALLLGGAIGKSAQLPLQTWLPDAMAGPTPVSALIHAATMVTAGVYLIARTHVLFTLAPQVQHAVAVIGAITLLVAGFSALAQKDIKRVLAYSTISQIGYMFLALGVGAWSAALFHFMTHAFFKALLFLAAGVVILAQRHEHDMFSMGGLAKRLPFTFWTFLVGAASLSALPLVTAGFYSKDLILGETLSSPAGGTWLWAAGLAGAFITALYAFRMVFVTFFGEAKIEISRVPKIRMALPLAVLAVLSIVGGFVNLPETLGNLPLFSTFLAPVFGDVAAAHHPGGTEIASQIAASAVSLAGILAAIVVYLWIPRSAERIAKNQAMSALRAFWFSGWGFDRLYDAVLVRPFLWVARTNRNDFVDSWYSAVASVNRELHALLSRSQTGNIRWYAAALAAGAVVYLGIVIFLR